MKIGLICEGCYPYIVGGVSAWIQQLVRNMPQHTYHIITIIPSSEMKGQFHFTLPDNVESVMEIALDEIHQQAKGFRPVTIPKTAKCLLEKMMLNKPIDYSALFDYFQNEPFRVPDLLMSRDFYEIAIAVYQTEYQTVKFAEFLWTLRSMYMTLFHILKQKLPDADIYHTVATGYAGVLAAMGKHTNHKPMIISEHGIYTREREEEIIKANWIESEFKNLWVDYFYTMSAAAYQFVDVAVSLFERAGRIQQSIGCDPAKTKVIANGIDVHIYDGSPEKEEEDTFVNIGAVLRVTPIKDVKTMIYAFSVVKKKNPYVKLYIMGPCGEDEDYYNECVALIEILDIEDIIFTGRIDVKDHIKKMDIILLTSISEGQPLSILEAFAACRPCVCTNVGCCNELIYGSGDGLGDAGFVVPIMDYEKIADALLRLSENASLRREMGNNGKKRLEAHYTEELFLQSYRELYQQFET